MIPAEAVEAAAKAFWPAWFMPDDEAMESLRAALEAAAPYIQQVRRRSEFYTDE